MLNVLKSILKEIKDNFHGTKKIKTQLFPCITSMIDSGLMVRIYGFEMDVKEKNYFNKIKKMFGRRYESIFI